MPKGMNAWDDLNDGRNPAPMGPREETRLTIVLKCLPLVLRQKAATTSSPGLELTLLESESFPLSLGAAAAAAAAAGVGGGRAGVPGDGLWPA